MPHRAAAQNTKHKYDKHEGAALLALVLVTFLLLAMLSAVAFNIAVMTKKTEIWQSGHRRQQMTLLARSAVDAAVEAVSNDTSMLSYTGSASSAKIQIYERDGKTKTALLTLAIPPTSSSIVMISATAETQGGEKAQKVRITGRYDKTLRKIVGWDRRDD